MYNPFLLVAILLVMAAIVAGVALNPLFFVLIVVAIFLPFMGRGVKY